MPMFSPSRCLEGKKKFIAILDFWSVGEEAFEEASGLFDW